MAQDTLDHFGRRSISVRIQKRQDNPKFWEAAGAYAQETIMNLEESLLWRLDGVPIPSPE
jgi:hypothetical protein